MMNKAKKRKLEVTAYADAYEIIERIFESTRYDVKYFVEKKAECLEENPEADTTYYDENIDEYMVKLKAYENTLEAIHKLM